MIVGRIFQGIGLSAPRTICIAIIRDLYQGDYMARVMSFVTIVFLLIPILAPAMGKFVLDSYSWQAIFYVQAAISVLVTIWFWIKFQATPGKMATQLRLVDEKTGLSISTGQAVGRYFATILSIVIFGLGYLWIVFDRRNQSWHDKLAGTVVIRNRQTERVIFNISKDNDEQEEKS